MSKHIQSGDTASGDLGGTFPSPNVLKINGTSISGTPANGLALLANSSTVASWQSLPAAPVSSVAGKTGAVALNETDISGLTTDLSAKAPLSSPIFTGKVTTPVSSTTSAGFIIPLGTAPTTPLDGDMWYDSTQKSIVQYLDGIRQYGVSSIYSQTAFNQVTNTAAETSAIGTGKGKGTLTLPANFWVSGKKVELKTKGSYQTPTTPGSVVVKIKLGTTVIAVATVAASILAGNSTTNELFGEAVITCYNTGTTGTVVCDGFLTFEIAAGTTTVSFSTAESVRLGTVTATSGSTSVSPAFATVTVDTTAAMTLDVTETWSNAQAGQGTTLNNVQAKVEF